MGVSGCGKSTIGRALAHKLDRPFIEGDDYHPAENIAKMQAAQPLGNADRRAWIDALCGAVNKSLPAVISCSALNAAVRSWLYDGAARELIFIHLSGTEALIAQRLSSRRDHFFDPVLLASQFAALETPQDAVAIDINQNIDAIVDACLAALDT